MNINHLNPIIGRQHLFDKAVNGYLRDKIHELVTRQLHNLKDVDQIVLIIKPHGEKNCDTLEITLTIFENLLFQGCDDSNWRFGLGIVITMED